MNLTKIKYSILGLSIVALALGSCNGGSEGNADGDADLLDSVAAPEVDEPAQKLPEPVYFQMPSPNDLFSLIKHNNLDYNPDLITIDMQSYGGSKAQALNFGRLTADIAYTSSFAKYQESISNFDNMRKLGNELGISYVFNEILVGRVKNNMDNSDSLTVITEQSYLNIVDMLEEHDKGSTLALIAAGGFVESLYLVLNLAGDYSDANTTVQSIADQKATFENLLGYLNKYEKDEDIRSVVTDLEAIKSTFESLQLQENGAAEISQNDKGRRILGGGGKITMTEAQFNALKEQVFALRTRYVEGNV